MLKTKTDFTVNDLNEAIVTGQNSYLQRYLYYTEENDSKIYYLFNDFPWPLSRNLQDSTYIILEKRFAYRPDLLAYVYYGTVELWWVVLKHNKLLGIEELKPGIMLEIPSQKNVFKALKDIRKFWR